MKEANPFRWLTDYAGDADFRFKGRAALPALFFAAVFPPLMAIRSVTYVI